MAAPFADYTQLGASQIADRIADGKLSVCDVCKPLLRRVQDRAEIKAWSHIDSKQVLEAASALDSVPLESQQRKSGVFGVPVGIKDIFYTKDMPTRHGSHRHEASSVAYDSAMVEVLRRAGCIIMGKTVTTEFAWTMNGKETLNPRNPSISPGGSSSGSAAAVADFQVPIAVGTQTFGSVIRPASYTGIYGWKPSYGLLPVAGGKFCAPTMDTIGFFSRTTKDLQRLGHVFRVPQNTSPTTGAQLSHISSWKVAILQPLSWESASHDAKNVLARCEDLLKKSGATIERISLPASFSNALAYQRKIAVKELVHAFIAEGDIQDSDDEMLRNFFKEGQNTPYADYIDALDAFAALRKEFDSIARQYTVVITLSATGEAPEGLAYTGDSRYNTLFTGLHNPVVNVPGLTSSKGNPIGISAASWRGNDMQLLEIAGILGELLE